MLTLIVIVLLALTGAAYVAADKAGRGLGRSERCAYAAGALTLLAALLPPLDEIAESRLWAHMVQHELLMLLGAPLLALGRPHAAVLRAVGGTARRTAARIARALNLGMGVAWTLHGLALWLWHIPALYEAAAAHPSLHALQHASFAGTAFLFWRSALDRRTGYGTAALYVFLTSLHSGLLGVLLFLSPRPWYPTYGRAADALGDQQLAGLIMWIPGGVVLTITAIALLWRWLNELDRRSPPHQEGHAAVRAFRTLLLIGCVAIAGIPLAGCDDARAKATALTGGDPDRGRDHIRKYGCSTCHTIPGIQGANATVGPPLDQIGSRAYVAGHPNSPSHLIEWIRHPQRVRSPTPMPDMGVTETDARDIAAYLYTLR
jgi:cytochrome c oxidase assembly factor CtaG/cytochrome c2